MTTHTSLSCTGTGGCQAVLLMVCLGLHASTAAAQAASATEHIAQLASHPMRVGAAAGGDAPGLYANYDWPKKTPQGDDSVASSADMQVDVNWHSIPEGTNTDGNGVFASSQYWYEAYDQPCPAKSDHGMSCNSAGYMGTQVMRGNGKEEKRVFIFSCWDADSKHKVSWTTPDTCSRFGGEGTGSHCMLEFPIKVGEKYNFKVEFDSKNASGAMWTGTVTDSKGKASKVGTLFYPHLPKRVGFGNFKIQSDDFLEWFAGGDCDAATAAVHISGPFFDKRKIMPTQAYSAYGAGCNHSAVTSSAKPTVLLSGGKGIVRTNADKTALW